MPETAQAYPQYNQDAHHPTTTTPATTQLTDASTEHPPTATSALLAPSSGRPPTRLGRAQMGARPITIPMLGRATVSLAGAGVVWMLTATVPFATEMHVNHAIQPESASPASTTQYLPTATAI